MVDSKMENRMSVNVSYDNRMSLQLTAITYCGISQGDAVYIQHVLYFIWYTCSCHNYGGPGV